MKKLFLGTLFLASVIAAPIPTMARVDVSVNIGLPPPIVFAAPPAVVVMPDTSDVYVVPDIEVDLFFWNGWWWRQWDGGWYRSRYYNRSWGYYNNVPSFYYDVDPGWRGYYRTRNWYGHRWDYERIPYQRMQQNWKGWKNRRHWERQRTWGVRSYQPRPQSQRQELRQQRQQQYQQRPEVQRQRQRVQQPQGRPQVQQPQGQPRVQQPQRRPQVQQPQGQPRVQQPQRRPQVQQPQGPSRVQQPKRSQPQGKPERGQPDMQDRR